jgi:hypothetical protein
LVATITLQPVPQKRQGAFDHVNRVFSDSVTMFAAAAGKLMPATLAATPAAWALMYCRRLIFMLASSFWIGWVFDLVKDQSHGQDSLELVNRINACEHLVLADALEGYYELSPGAGAVDLGTVESADGGLDGRDAFRACLHHQAGNMHLSVHGVVSLD